MVSHSKVLHLEKRNLNKGEWETEEEDNPSVWGSFTLDFCSCKLKMMCVILNRKKKKNDVIVAFMASLVAQTVKNLPAMQETPASTPRSGRSSEEENGNPLQYPCLENPMDREAWWATTHKLQSDTRLSNFHFTDTCDHPESANFIWTDPTVNQ